MSHLIQRPALGQEAAIGTFYDAKSDAFLPFSLLNKSSSDSIERTEIYKKVVQVSYVDSYEDKFQVMGVEPELQASILAGLLHPGGSGCYLSEKLEGERTLQAAIHHKITTVQERLNFRSSDLRDCIALTTLRTSAVTHIVSEIEWGMQSIVTAKHWLLDERERCKTEDRFRAEVETLKAAAEDSPQVDSKTCSAQVGTELSVELVAYSDILSDEGVVMNDFQEACTFLELMPLHAKSENDHKGKPISYTLLIVSMLPMFLPVQIDADIRATLPSNECLKKFVQLFDEFRVCQQKLDGYQSYVSKHNLCMSRDHLKDVADRVAHMRLAAQNLKSNYASILKKVRGGTSYPEELWQLATSCTHGELSPTRMASIADDHREKVEFIDTMMAKGATYIGYNGLDLSTELSRQSDVDAYVFSFSDMTIQDQISWRANQALLLELLDEPHRQHFVAIVDCDATATTLEQSFVSHYRNGSAVTGDLLEHRQFVANNSFARCNPERLETVKLKPVKSRFVKIACPGRNCNSSEICSWLCSECHSPLEYGFSDQYLYCECGTTSRSLYRNYAFKCNSELHGSSFDEYDQNLLLSLLNNLDQSDYLNILILGETGVGKSTFINAFVNYLSFETLDDAVNADKLNCVIPCSFSVPTMNRSRPDSAIEEEKVKVGFKENEENGVRRASDADEKDGSAGGSATQRAAVYPITIGTTTYRLIDTPGIGDTRGMDFEKTNMSDILSTLSIYDDLHGVLILLESNNSRMTPNFAFCVKELLVHLHRSAAENMVFGFKNTRSANYTPGDTLGSLKTLLAEHPDVGLSISNSTTYCFDSESFRYLAAHKSGVFMDNEEDFRRSWNHSRDEAWRMLHHIQSKIPHPIKNTISLNGTHELISYMTKPMAEISQLIRTNVSLCEDQIKELKNTQLTGNQLRKKLYPQVKLVRRTPFDRPRTVCGDKSCIDFKDDGTGTNTMMTDYFQHCHRECYITDVKVDVRAHPELIKCKAFLISDFCNRCRHHWTMHLHVLHELEEYTETVKDSEIDKQLQDHAADVTLKQTAIKARESLVKEYRKEHDQIRKTATKFALFLKKNSITPYNDATIAYLDMLIKDEEAKVKAGGIGNVKKLQALKEDRHKHEELVEVIERGWKSNINHQPLDPQGVDLLVKELYHLKHFGTILEKSKKALAAAHEGTYREQPLRVQGKSTWGNTFQSPIHKLLGTSSSPQHEVTHTATKSRPTMPAQPATMGCGFQTGTMRSTSRHSQLMMENPSQQAGDTLGQLPIEAHAMNRPPAHTSHQKQTPASSSEGIFSKKTFFNLFSTHPHEQ